MSKSVSIEFAGKEVEMSLNQAHELQAALTEMFEDYVSHKYPVPYPAYEILVEDKVRVKLKSE